MGGAKKPYLTLAGEPVLLHALRPFLAREDVVALAVALAPEETAAPPAWLARLGPRVVLIAGGESRTDSVRAALAALPADLDVILVHDAARPLLTPDVLERCVRVAAQGRGAVAGFPAVDTLKEVDGSGRILGTPERTRFWHAQTPQAFPAALIRSAYASGEVAEGATDDASLVERLGGEVVMVEASPRNLKVTRPGDLALAELLLRSRESQVRADGAPSDATPDMTDPVREPTR
jgi:2-C-methyl-D-erythritol 4-phosphate cytidylyltransferase